MIPCRADRKTTKNIIAGKHTCILTFVSEKEIQKNNEALTFLGNTCSLDSLGIGKRQIDEKLNLDYKRVFSLINNAIIRYYPLLGSLSLCSFVSILFFSAQLPNHIFIKVGPNSTM